MTDRAASGSASVPVLTYAERGTGLRVDLNQLVASRMLVQANSGGGKSRAIRQLLEETHGRIQHLVIDPEGEFATLRERFDYVLAAKHGGEALAAPRTAKLLCRRLVELGASAVLDLYELDLHERREFVKLFLVELVNLPRVLWRPILVVIDEAHVFAPQTGESQALDAVISLCTLGRKRGFAAVLATQRISKLHKDAAAELNNKLIGRTGLDVDVKRAGDELGFDKDGRQQLAHLEPGEFFAYGPAISPTVVRVRTGQVTTTHPEPGQVSAAPTPAPAKIEAMLAQLGDLPKEAEEEARTIEEFRRQTTELRRKITVLEKNGRVVEKSVTVVDQKAIDRAVTIATREQAALIKQLRHALDAAMKFVVTITAQNFDIAGIDKTEVEAALKSAMVKVTEMVDRKLTARSAEIDALRKDAARLVDRIKRVRELDGEPVAVDVSVTHNEPFSVDAGRNAPPIRMPRVAASSNRNGNGNGLGSIAKGERIVLTAIAQYPEGVERDQLTVLTGYKRSTRDAYVQRLQTAGYVAVNGGTIVASDDGVAALGDSFEPLPTGEALRDYWLNRLPEGEAKVLSVVLEANGEPVDRETISDSSGYKRSTRDAYIQRLTARRLVESVGRGEVRASATLFPEGLA